MWDDECVCVCVVCWCVFEKVVVFRQFVLRAPMIAWLNQSFSFGGDQLPGFKGGSHSRSNADGEGNCGVNRSQYLSRQDVHCISRSKLSRPRF